LFVGIFAIYRHSDATLNSQETLIGATCDGFSELLLGVAEPWVRDDEHPAGAVITGYLNRGMSETGWSVATIDNWRDSGWIFRCDREKGQRSGRVRGHTGFLAKPCMSPIPLFSSIMAPLTAGGDMTVTCYGTMPQSATAGGDAVIFAALGITGNISAGGDADVSTGMGADLTGNVVAGQDLSAVAWGFRGRANLTAGRDLQVLAGCHDFGHSQRRPRRQRHQLWDDHRQHHRRRQRLGLGRGHHRRQRQYRRQRRSPKLGRDRRHRQLPATISPSSARATSRSSSAPCSDMTVDGAYGDVDGGATAGYDLDLWAAGSITGGSSGLVSGERSRRDMDASVMIFGNDFSSVSAGNDATVQIGGISLAAVSAGEYADVFVAGNFEGPVQRWPPMLS